MSTETTEQRAREPCDACGLPYYVDENDSCPYCGESHAEQSEPRTDTGEAESPTADAKAEAEAERRRRRTDRSLLDRIANSVRNVIGK